MYCDFLGRAGDEIFNQLAKWQSMSAGVLQMPVVLRVSVGNKYGAQHSQDWAALVHHIPGLKVAFPVTPYDAKGMLKYRALAGSDPVIFLESQRLYGIGEEFEETVPEEYYEVPLGEPACRRKGTDLTIVTVGATLYTALKAADELEEKYGISAKSGTPAGCAHSTTSHSSNQPRRPVASSLASDACERGSVMHDMASTITQSPSVTSTHQPWWSVLVTGSPQAQNWKMPTSHK